MTFVPTHPLMVQSDKSVLLEVDNPHYYADFHPLCQLPIRVVPPSNCDLK